MLYTPKHKVCGGQTRAAGRSRKQDRRPQTVTMALFSSVVSHKRNQRSILDIHQSRNTRNKSSNTVAITFVLLLLVVLWNGNNSESGFVDAAAAFVDAGTSHRSFHKISRAMSDGNAPTTETKDGVSIGFIGCGTIAAAIVSGLALQTDVPIASIVVSKRSVAKSTKLCETYPNLVSVREDNQDILDESDLVFVCVLPEQTSEVLQAIKFDTTRHYLISLVSTATLSALQTDSTLPADRVAKMICE